ncbi:MAG: HAMP domain-containing histidine kinase [Nocardioidaceae bacterium]|nr:HAMP domain-containing histidine kinase [Nocardioidaceae bacterium]MCO5323065.1 HAMP domain-containing histidine kinase [Nocardioidaceae bacterium]
MDALRLVRDATSSDEGLGAAALEALAEVSQVEAGEIVDNLRTACDTEFAAISIQDGDKFRLAITSGFTPFVADADQTICVQTMDCHYTFEVSDASQDQRFQHSIYVNGDSGDVRSYASAPIYNADNTMVGRLCVFDSAVRDLAQSQLHYLASAAHNLSTVISQQQQRRRRDGPSVAGLDASDEVLRIAAQISHDMRLPLSSLQLTLEMLDDLITQGGSPVKRKLVDSAQRSTKRLSGMVEGLLEMHQLGHDLEVVGVELYEVARQVIAELGPVLHQAQATVQVRTMPKVKGDPRLLYSLLLNLIGNSVKFARPGVPPQIKIDSRRVSDGWECTVTDNGVGVPTERRAAVFETFARLNPAIPGNGIGLPTVARIARAHGGQAGVRDHSDGPGAQFWFTLTDQGPHSIPVEEGP